MGIVRTYAIHAIDDDELCAAPIKSEGPRGFNYADLIKRARIGVRDAHGQPNSEAHRSLAAGERTTASHYVSSANQPSHSSAPIDQALEERHGDPTHSPSDRHSLSTTPGGAQACTRQTGACAPGESLTQRLQQLDAPYLDALASEQQRLVLADYLASRVADFCTDPAVLSQGHWTMRLTLDPTILPDCALSLTLSYFDLTLRFETNHASSRQLVLHHADVLKRRLEVLLAQHDAPRTVEIVAQ